MKKPYKSWSFYLMAAALTAVSFTSGCSSSTSVTTNDGTISMQSQLATSDVDRSMPSKVPVPSGLDVDSITVRQAIVFVSDIKLHSDEDDTDIDTHDKEIKTGPFVLVFDSGTVHVVTNATIPAGTYDRVKFEFHKPDKNDDAAILAQYPQLENGGQTYSVYISGFAWKNGVATAFYVRSIRSENKTLRFEHHDVDFTDAGNLVLNANTTTTLALELDPRIVFRIGGLLSGLIFDPNDSTNQDEIDTNILIAIRVVEF